MLLYGHMPNRDTDRWLSYRREVPGARLRLFCFPFGGGGATVFSSWPRAVPAGVEVCPVQPPGRENRFAEPPLTSMPEMIDRLAEVLPAWLDLPYALFGHSLGAMVVFELARRLRREGRRSPEWLFVSGHPAPHLPRRRPLVSRLPRPEFLRSMRDDFEVEPLLLDTPELLELIYPALRADYEVVESYRYEEEPPFDLPLSVFGGRRDPEATEAELQAWQRHTAGPFRVRVLEGNHMFINTAREELTAEVARDLSQALQTL